MRLDLSKSFELVPEGDYEVVLTDAEVRESKKKSGTFYANWEFTIKGGPNDDGKVWGTNALSQAAAWAFANSLVAFGCNTDEVAAAKDLDPEEVVPKLAGLGVVCMVKVEHGTYNDKPTVNVVEIRRSVNTKPISLAALLGNGEEGAPPRRRVKAE